MKRKTIIIKNKINHNIHYNKTSIYALCMPCICYVFLYTSLYTWRGEREGYMRQSGERESRANMNIGRTGTGLARREGGGGQARRRGGAGSGRPTGILGGLSASVRSLRSLSRGRGNSTARF